MAMDSAHRFPGVVGEELGALAVVGPGAVGAACQHPAPVHVTPPVGMAWEGEGRVQAWGGCRWLGNLVSLSGSGSPTIQ